MTGRPTDNQSHHLPSHMMCTAEPPTSYAAKSNSQYNDSSNDIYLEVTQMTIIICLPVGRHSCNERSGHESGVQLHDAPTVLTSTADNYDGDSPLWPANSKPTVLDVAECRCWLLVRCCYRLFEL